MSPRLAIIPPLFLLCTASTVVSGLLRQCGAPGVPVGGSVSPSGFSRGSLAHYRCGEGRVMTGLRTRQCGEDGQWAGEIPVCRPSLSYNRSTLQSSPSSLHPSHLAVDGDPASCAVTEGGARWWQVQINPSQVQSVGLVLPVNTSFQLSIFVIELLEDNKASYKPCSSFSDLTTSPYVVFTCNQERGLLGEFIYIRDERREEQPLRLCEVEIFSVVEEDDLECGTPDSPAGGRVASLEGVAKYECDPGLEVVAGQTTRLCHRGQWEGSPPLCSQSECHSPVSPSDGFIKITNFTGSFVPGTTATYFCSPGFSLSGGGSSQSRTCSSAGQWTGDQPACLPVSCGAPPPLNNTLVQLLNHSTTLHSTALYHCLHLNTRQNNTVLVTHCMEDGEWSPVEGLCPVEMTWVASSSSSWAVVTISVLVVIILLLLSYLLWLQGGHRLAELLAQRKPSLMSQGVCTRSSNSSEILQFRASIKLPPTVPSTPSSLSTFYKNSGSVIGIKAPRQQQPVQDSTTTGSISSERSSGDGEESLYATIRRKKSSKSCQLQQGEDERSAQLFIPELMNKLESEPTVASEAQSDDHSSTATECGLVKPSQIKRFVSTQAKSCP